MKLRIVQGWFQHCIFDERRIFLCRVKYLLIQNYLSCHVFKAFKISALFSLQWIVFQLNEYFLLNGNSLSVNPQNSVCVCGGGGVDGSAREYKMRVGLLLFL